MKIALLLAICCFTLAASTTRTKRQAYQLPDGAELLLTQQLRTSFQCTSDGYYADVDNACQVFHVCHTAQHADGNVEIQQWSFLCGNQTVFNQLTFTCAHYDEAVPCQNAPDFFYLNANIGQENVHFLNEQDLQRAEPLLAPGSRIPRPQVSPPQTPPPPQPRPQPRPRPQPPYQPAYRPPQRSG